MIAVDTNVPLRYLLRDDEARVERSRRVFERDKRILITDVVLAEAVWTLIGRRYRATKAELWRAARGRAGAAGRTGAPAPY